MQLAKDTAGLAVPAAVLLVVKTRLANWARKNSKADSILYQMGPLYPVAVDIAAIYAVPKFILKGKNSKYRKDFDTIAKTFLALDSIKLLTYLARHEWKLTGGTAAIPGADNYPGWTDWLSLSGGQLHGAHGYSQPARLSGARDVSSFAPSQGSQFYDPEAGRWLVAA